MITELHTTRLQLSQMKASDSTELFQVWSDPEVAMFMNISPFSDEKQALEMIQLLADLAKEKRLSASPLLKRNRV